MRRPGVSAVALSLLLQSFCQLAAAQSFSGTITYTGSHGPISASRPLCLCLYADSALQLSFGCYIFSNNAAAYQIPASDVNEYYLIAFVDLQRNDRHDASEPYEIYRDRSVPPGDPVHGGDTNVDLSFGDENLQSTPTTTPSASETPTATETATPTPMCVGDCDASGEVTIDEIITMVNVTLGQLDLSACSAGDADGNRAIDISEIIRAVVNDGAGCNTAS